jgi:hypothetical protein
MTRTEIGRRRSFRASASCRRRPAAPSEENKHDPKPLFAPDVSGLLEGIRAVPGLVEATTRLVGR